MQLAARHEEDTFGSTAIGFLSAACSDGQLGSGTILEDPKELAMNIGRIEGWRRSVSYDLCKVVSRLFLSPKSTSWFPLLIDVFVFRISQRNWNVVSSVESI